jgi:hypothetical protein
MQGRIVLLDLSGREVSNTAYVNGEAGIATNTMDRGVYIVAFRATSATVIGLGRVSLR